MGKNPIRSVFAGYERGTRGGIVLRSGEMFFLPADSERAHLRVVLGSPESTGELEGALCRFKSALSRTF